MGSSRQQVLTSVLSKCLALYELPHAKTDPAYEAMLDIYTDQLRPFDPWELQEGMTVLIQRRKHRKWPAVGEIAAACDEARRDRLPPEKRGQKRLEAPKPERAPLSQEERELIAFKLEVLGEWKANGKLNERVIPGNKNSPYRYTLQDCIAEASTRQQAWNHKLTQKQERRRA